jgi:RNA polymerase sigma factor (sigma-70 family)
MRVAEGDEAAVHTLVEANLRLVFKVAARFRQSGVVFDDVVQEGMLGLLHAARHFHANGTAFSTYAVACIEGAIRKALGRDGSVVHVPRHHRERLTAMRRATARLEQERGRAVTDTEVAEALGWTLRQVWAAGWRGEAAISLSAPIVGAEEGGSDLTLEGLLMDDRAVPADEEAIDRQRAAQLRGAIARLRPKEAAVLRLRYGLDGEGPMTMAEAGARLGCSRQRVEQVEKETLRRLRLSARRVLA